MKKLTPKHKIFCTIYYNDKDVAKAMREAGYDTTSGYGYGYRLLQKPMIKNFLADLDKDIVSYLEPVNARIVPSPPTRDVEMHNIPTLNRLVGELCKIAFIDIGDFYDEDGKLKSFADLPTDLTCAMAGITTQGVKVYDKVKAIEVLARLLGYDSTTLSASKTKDKRVQIVQYDRTV